MPVTREEMDRDLIPLAGAYKAVGITPEKLAKARLEALEAERERTLKVKGASVSSDKLPSNLTVVSSSEQETVMVHRTVDHGTRLEAARDIEESAGWKPSKKIDLQFGASGLLAEVLKDIDGKTRGLPSQRRDDEEDE